MKAAVFLIGSILCSIILAGCASQEPQQAWITLLDASSGLNNFNRVGDASWVVTEQGIEAQDQRQQSVFLMTKNGYQDFLLHIEFWVSDDANSGVYMRCQDPENPTDTSCYEANIFDQRPDQTYATGGIVHVAPAPTPVPRAGGRWNTYEIRLEGSQLTVKLNGATTANVSDTRFSQGHIGLQWGAGIIRFRQVKIKPL